MMKGPFFLTLRGVIGISVRYIKYFKISQEVLDDRGESEKYAM